MLCMSPIVSCFPSFWKVIEEKQSLNGNVEESIFKASLSRFLETFTQKENFFMRPPFESITKIPRFIGYTYIGSLNTFQYR